MADVYSEIFYHFVWATKLRHPYLTPEIELLVWDKMRRKCQELEVRVFALDGMPDHLHLVCDVPPKLAAARLIKHVKGSSSHLINHFDEQIALYWQVGYSAHTFSKSALSTVVAYVNNQKKHHREGSLKPNLEFIPDPYPDSTPEGFASP